MAVAAVFEPLSLDWLASAAESLASSLEPYTETSSWSRRFWAQLGAAAPVKQSGTPFLSRNNFLACFCPLVSSAARRPSISSSSQGVGSKEGKDVDAADLSATREQAPVPAATAARECQQPPVTCLGRAKRSIWRAKEQDSVTFYSAQLEAEILPCPGPEALAEHLTQLLLLFQQHEADPKQLLSLLKAAFPHLWEALAPVLELDQAKFYAHQSQTEADSGPGGEPNTQPRTTADGPTPMRLHIPVLLATLQRLYPALQAVLLFLRQCELRVYKDASRQECLLVGQLQCQSSRQAHVSLQFALAGGELWWMEPESLRAQRPAPLPWASLTADVHNQVRLLWGHFNIAVPSVSAELVTLAPSPSSSTATRLHVEGHKQEENEQAPALLLHLRIVDFRWPSRWMSAIASVLHLHMLLDVIKGSWQAAVRFVALDAEKVAHEGCSLAQQVPDHGCQLLASAAVPASSFGTMMLATGWRVAVSRYVPAQALSLLCTALRALTLDFTAMSTADKA